MTPAELAADLRTRINPKYANQLGCESYLNRQCAEMIEGLIAVRDALTRSIDQWRTAYYDLRLERDALQADAARWRYMRQKGANWFAISEKARDINFDGGLDEAVDEAMKEHS